MADRIDRRLCAQAGVRYPLALAMYRADPCFIFLSRIFLSTNKEVLPCWYLVEC